MILAFVTIAFVSAEFLAVYTDVTFDKLNPITGALTRFQSNTSLPEVSYAGNTLDVNHKRFYWTGVSGGRWTGYKAYISGHDFVTNNNLMSPSYNVSEVSLSCVFYDQKEDILYALHSATYEILVVDIDTDNGGLALGKSIGKLHADGYDLPLKIVQYDYRYGILYMDSYKSIHEDGSLLLGFDLKTGEIVNKLKISDTIYSEIIHSYLDFDKDQLVVFDVNNSANATVLTYTINLKTGDQSVPYTVWDQKAENRETRNPLFAFDINTEKAVLVFDEVAQKLQKRVIYFDVLNKQRISDSTIPWSDIKTIISTPFSV
jgi:hypothetical protein